MPLFRINNKLTKKHNIDTKNVDLLKKHPQRYLIFNGLKLIMSNLRNLLQRNRRNSVMKH